jgi:hypothetical protein
MLHAEAAPSRDMIGEESRLLLYTTAELYTTADQ